jgi:ribosome biogenesis GTPase
MKANRVRVKEALESGELSRERWESYLRLKSEARYTDDKAGFLSLKQKRFKGIAKQVKQMEKDNRKFGGEW